MVVERVDVAENAMVTTTRGGESGLALYEGGMPSIAAVRHRMQWMAEFRGLLIEYVQKSMDPQRHMYTFANGAYRRIGSSDEIAGMLAKGQKPALNQDGVHNLMALYDADAGDMDIHEERDGGHYSCRVTVRMTFFGGKCVVGVGSASSRESKYAYRWVYERDVPRGLDKASLKTKTYEPEGKRPYTRYRLDNEDLADIENTVLKMAAKRARSAAVQQLPGVSEMFASIGDADEENESGGDERQELLGSLRAWLGGLGASQRARALLAVFGEPIQVADVPKLEEDRLAMANQVVDIANRGGVNWKSVTLVDDVRRLCQASAKQATADLFGDQASEGRNVDRAPTNAGTTEGAVWRDTIRAHRDALAGSGISTLQASGIVGRIDAALADKRYGDSDGLALAADVLDWLAVMEEAGE